MRIIYLFFISLLHICTLSASDENITKYLEYLSAPNFGQIGDYTAGEMQIIENFDAIIKVQSRYYDEFIQRGFSSRDAEKNSLIGVVAEDKYWIWLRDPLILPNGKSTAYNRFFPKSGLNGPAGVSVMGISKDQKVLVNVIFRHATREWEIELPRGGRGKNELAKEAALRELAEETGVLAKDAIKIASIASDSGILANILDVFVVKDLLFSHETKREDCEAIHDCRLMSKEELKQAFVNGSLELKVNGNKVKVFCRDSFLGSAILIAEARGLL